MRTLFQLHKNGGMKVKHAFYTGFRVGAMVGALLFGVLFMFSMLFVMPVFMQKYGDEIVFAGALAITTACVIIMGLIGGSMAALAHRYFH